MTTSQTKTISPEFNVESFEGRLEKLKDTQDSIQQMSSWCLEHRVHHKKIIASWLNVIKKVKVEHRLNLFYLANDVIQNSKRKKYEFVESWCTALQRATTMVREEKVKKKVFRIFKIWEQRGIYSEDYLSDLNGLLSMCPPQKKTQQGETDEFQNAGFFSKIKECEKLSHQTDRSFKSLPKPPKYGLDDIKYFLKDKSQTECAIKEVDHYIHSVEKYIQNLIMEIKSRKHLIKCVKKADQFYTNQHTEVKVVVNAYKNFGNRIMVVLKKLDEVAPDLPSPITSPDINAPSPEPDDDIKLPDDNTSNFSMNTLKNENGFKGFMDRTHLPFNINDFKSDSTSQKIEVINNRSEVHPPNYNSAEFYKPIESLSSYLASPLPRPVPPVQSEYSSLAQTQSSSASPYGSHPPYQIHDNSYNPMNLNYSNESEYGSNLINNSYHDQTSLPLMPPPPMPSLPSLGGSQSDEFNSTWDMSMSWTSMNSTNSFGHSNETPHSPSSYFDREPINSTQVIECRDESNVDLAYRQDVEHRQLHITPSNIPTLPLKKGRCVDIDHRNLISLTGSPQLNDDKPVNNPHVWVKGRELYPETTTNPSFDCKESLQDTDLRTINLPTINNQIDNGDNKMPSSKSPTILPPLQPPPIFSNIKDLLKYPLSRDAPKFSSTPTKSVYKVPDHSQPRNSEIPHANRIETNYDPGECVETVDMEMSDEDFEDLFIDNAIDYQSAVSEDHAQLNLDDQMEQEAELRQQHLQPQPLQQQRNQPPHNQSVQDSEGIYEDLWENQQPEIEQTDSYNQEMNNGPQLQHINPSNRWEGGGNPRNPFAGNPIEMVNIPIQAQNPPQRLPNPAWVESPQRMTYRPQAEIRAQQFSPPRPQFPFSRNPFAGGPRNFALPDFRPNVRPRVNNNAPYFNNNRGRGGAFPGPGRGGNFRGNFHGNLWQ